MENFVKLPCILENIGKLGFWLTSSSLSSRSRIHWEFWLKSLFISWNCTFFSSNASRSLKSLDKQTNESQHKLEQELKEILTKNVMCYFDQNFKNHQTTSTNSHSCRLQCTNCPRIPAKGYKLLNLSKKNLHAILPQKLLIIFLQPFNFLRQEMQKNCRVYAFFVTF